MLRKIKIPAIIANFVRSTQSFFATHAELWKIFKSHWISRLIGPTFLLCATFGLFETYNNYKKAHNKNFDKLLALSSILVFQFTLLMGVVISPILLSIGVSMKFLYPPAWIIFALTINTFNLITKSLIHYLRGISHDDLLEQNKNLSVSVFSLQNALASGTMAGLLFFLQTTGGNSIFVPLFAVCSTFASAVCLKNELFDSKIYDPKKIDIPPAKQDLNFTRKSKPTHDTWALFSHRNRTYYLEQMSENKGKLFLNNEINTKLTLLQKHEMTEKRVQKINLLSDLLTDLNHKRNLSSKEKILVKNPLAFQSISILTGKSDIEDIYDACLSYSNKYFNSNMNTTHETAHPLNLKP